MTSSRDWACNKVMTVPPWSNYPHSSSHPVGDLVSTVRLFFFYFLFRGRRATDRPTSTEMHPPTCEYDRDRRVQTPIFQLSLWKKGEKTRRRHLKPSSLIIITLKKWKQSPGAKKERDVCVLLLDRIQSHFLQSFCPRKVSIRELTVCSIESSLIS